MHFDIHSFKLILSKLVIKFEMFVLPLFTEHNIYIDY